ncbi:MAG: substrate-binding domain-containing protein [Acetobacteraceae bacterium]
MLAGLACGITPSQAKDVTLGLAVANLQAPFFNFIKRAVSAAAQKAGDKVITADANGDSAKQVSQVQDLISRKVEALIYIPAGATAAAIPVQAARKAHIPVVAVDRNPPSAPADSFVATDSVQAAKELGDYICKDVGGKGTMAVVQGQLGTTPEVARTEGMQEALKSCPGVKVVIRQASKQWHENEGYDIAQAMLQRNPNITIIWGQADALALGAAQALRSAHLSHKVHVYGFDGDPSGLEAVKNGAIDATMCQKTNYMGKLAFETAIKLINGQAVPKEQLQSAVLVTKANAEKYIANHP